MTSLDRDELHQQATFEDLIDLKAFFRVLRKYKWLIAGVVVAGTVMAVIVALLISDVYRASALLAPNEEQGDGGLSSLAEQYGGLAALAGINMMGGSDEKTMLGLEILSSRKFFADFAERHDVLVPLIAARGWDRESGELIIDRDDYDVESGKWIRKVRYPKKVIPSMQEAHEVFLEDVLSISQNSKTGFVTVNIEHFSPVVAKQWVDWLVEDINETIMRRDVREAQQAIDYLNEQIKATSLAQLQSVFSRLIEEQTKTIMLAAVTDEYLFKTVDPAVVPEYKTRPKRALIVVIGMLLSAVLAVLMAVALHSRDNS